MSSEVERDRTLGVSGRWVSHRHELVLALLVAVAAVGVARGHPRGELRHRRRRVAHVTLAVAAQVESESRR